MAETLRSDGKAVDVVVDSTITKGDVVYKDGFAGIAMQDAVSGETIALEIATREHEINVGGITAISEKFQKKMHFFKKNLPLVHKL